ncbi:hypothetical protein [Basilea psittacipulmonis]|nr:hypothetical protein [Basilea psittacipulmonis]
MMNACGCIYVDKRVFEVGMVNEGCKDGWDEAVINACGCIFVDKSVVGRINEGDAAMG